MRAVRIRAPGGLDRLEIVELPDPGAPAADEIRVRIRASSLNYHDYRVSSGDAPSIDCRIPMADGAGVIEAIGGDVSDFEVGDRVVSVFFPQWHDGPPRVVGDFSHTPGDGVDGYAREVVVRPSSWFTRAPAGYTYAEAATLTTAGVTAWRALVSDGKLKAGDTVLVLGTGGVSIFALQIARSMGATVIATSSSDAKLERLSAMGAAHTINYRTQPDWGRGVTDWMGGQGVDHVMEVGGAATLPQSISAIRIGGRISLIGALTGRSGELPTVALIVKNVCLQGVTVGSRSDQTGLIAGLETTGVKPVIDRSFPLEELAQAFKYQIEGRHFGKIVVEF
ncbi:zinc-dependent alcohol dehydrogenase family protein [Caballeronia sordidicola]|uniref:zinc-dependent alcohol dehydrogenase family protein n=1 Tax=Caballeronia sordidicola TaxID=196367 RepID=UPI0004CFF466|nr:NAD(P)-dependent alcohol dehydrogenase [Caballeronia sordidicola]